jgi:hypothetical protein
MYAYLISKLSKESQDEIQGHANWPDIEKTRDPLKLWKVIKACHQILTTSKVAAVINEKPHEKNTPHASKVLSSILWTTKGDLMPNWMPW